MSNTEIKNVLIAGASGSLGSAILTELLASKTFNVFVLTREESKTSFPTEAHVLKSAYTANALTALLTSLPTPIDAVISNLSGAEGLSSAQLALIDASKVTGVKRFFPSEFGGDTTNEEVLKIVPLLKGKREIVSYLRSKEDDRFSWTAIVTGLFLDWGLAQGFTEIDVKNKKFVKWDGGSVPFSATNLRTIGKAIANTLSSPERLAATANKYVYISSHTVTQNELFEVVKRSVAEISGTEGTWTIENVDSEEAARKAHSALAVGDFSRVFDLFRAVNYGKLGLNNHSKLGSNELLGLEKENFEEGVKKVVQEILSAKA